jgi:hypothetical protein
MLIDIFNGIFRTLYRNANYQSFSSSSLVSLSFSLSSWSSWVILFLLFLYTSGVLLKYPPFLNIEDHYAKNNESVSCDRFMLHGGSNNLDECDTRRAMNTAATVNEGKLTYYMIAKFTTDTPISIIIY